MKQPERKSYQVYLEQTNLDECQKIVAARPIEELILQCDSDRRIDIGALCYSERKVNFYKFPTPVIEASFRLERCDGFRSWCVDQITSYFTGDSGSTVARRWAQISKFVDWCDNHGFEAFMTCAPAYKAAIDNYTQHLIATTKTENGLSHYSAQQYQSEVLRCGAVFFPATTINFLDDLPIISNIKPIKNPTKTPSEKEIADHLTPCQYLFDGITEFLLKQIDFPHRIPFMSGEARLLPAEYPIITDAVYERTPKIYKSIFWNYKSGTVNSLSACISNANQPENRVTRRRNEALEVLEQANKDPQHPKRIWLAKLAHDAFFCLFVANTGINDTQARKLPWSDSYDVFESKNAGFYIIKPRAAGREGEIEIRKTFMKPFKRFIKLRDHICKNNSHKYLFLNISRNNINDEPIKISTISDFNSKVRSFLDPDFKGLRARRLRKYKNVYLLSKKHPIEVASALMQTSVTTILKNYADAEEKRAIDEISSMLALLMSVLDDKEVLNTPAGDCADIDNPSSMIPPPEAYKPNCKNFVGCLFCIEFRLHANEDSIRKLLSMSYVTKEYLRACTDIDQFREIHGEALNQIERILSELITTRPEMEKLVVSIRDEVEQQYKLTSYWERVYERLIKLKVLK